MDARRTKKITRFVQQILTILTTTGINNYTKPSQTQTGFVQNCAA